MGTTPSRTYIKSSIVTPDDWKKVKAERFRLDDPQRMVDIEALKREHPADRDYPLGVWVGSMIGKIRDMLTFEGLSYAIYDYPLMVEDMVETACQMVEHSLDQILPHFQFDYAAGWEDICYKSGPIVNPRWFHRVITPRYKRIHNMLESARHRHLVDRLRRRCAPDLAIDDGGRRQLPFPLRSQRLRPPGRAAQRIWQRPAHHGRV